MDMPASCMSPSHIPVRANIGVPLSLSPLPLSLSLSPSSLSVAISPSLYVYLPPPHIPLPLPLSHPLPFVLSLFVSPMFISLSLSHPLSPISLFFSLSHSLSVSLSLFLSLKQVYNLHSNIHLIQSYEIVHLVLPVISTILPPCKASNPSFIFNKFLCPQKYKV